MKRPAIFQEVLQNACVVYSCKIGANTAENERNLANVLITFAKPL